MATQEAPAASATPDCVPADDGYPEILEIRVHGVANTPPAVMLEVDPDKVKRPHGDELGSFWIRDLNQQDCDDHIARVEAYSWGEMARTGASALAVIGQAFVHIGWLFILPFGLCNTAYWMRPIPSQLDDAKREESRNARLAKRGKPPAVEPRVDASDWRGGPGAATIRIFGLVLTLIYITAFMAIAVDLVAVQCFTGKQVCATLPTFLDGLRDIDRGARAAIFSLLPIAAMLVIYLIARRGRVTWEPSINAFAKEYLAGEKPAKEQAAPKASVAGREAIIAPATTGSPTGTAEEPIGRPILATRGFWTSARTGPTSERLHFAAALALVLLLLSWDAAFSSLSQCLEDDPTADPTVVVGYPGCVADAWGSGAPAQRVGLVAVGVAVALLLWATISVAVATDSRNASSDKRKRAHAAFCLSVAATVYVGYVLFALLAPYWLSPPAVDDPLSARFVGLIATPTVLLVIGLGLTFLMLAIGTQANLRRSIPLMLLLGVAYLVSVLFTSILWWAFFVVMGIVLILHFVSPGWPRQQGRWYDLSFVGWRGLGVIVAMLAALLVAMIISSLLVLGLERWLDPGPVPAATDGLRDYSTVLAPEVLTEPAAYGRYAVVLSGVVVVLLLLVVAVLAKLLTRLPRFTVPELIPKETEDHEDSNRGGVITPTAGYADLEPNGEDRHVRQMAIARRTAAMLHRGEPLLGWITVLAAIGFLTLASPTGYRWVVESIPLDTRIGIREAAINVLAATAVAAVALVVTHASTKNERPLGVFWDVICFFPRAGHPFAPPCYAERAVPELTKRIAAWLEYADLKGKVDATGKPLEEKPRAVVIAAHSMGSVVAAASIFALTDNTAQENTRAVEKLALLSYGTQLRAFFSRFFPDVLGPLDLGIRPTRGPSLFMRDPWTRQIRAEWSTLEAEEIADGEARGDLADGEARTEPSRGFIRTDYHAVRYEALSRREESETERAYTLFELLGATGHARPRWISLWRRTDFLGFPVWSHNGEANPLDRGASEYVPNAYTRRVVAHDYLGTAQYLRARQDLATMLKERHHDAVATKG